MKVFASTLSRAQKSAILGGVVVAAIAIYLLTYQFLPGLLDTTRLLQWIDSFGIFAPVIFVLIQTAQVIFAPIPGQLLALSGGYLFGPVYGTIYSLLGVTVGSSIAFLLTKRYGRPLVERVLHEDVIAGFDGFIDRVGLPGFIAFIIIPGLPDDAVCFLAGLTKWRLRTFIFAIIIGRFPAYVLTVYAGGELASGRFVVGVVLISVLVVLSAVGYFKQQEIQNWVYRLEERIRF
ncbi:TVP38/TMEM64 family protein [Halosolutus gelatinilyticus]|uniref:TVP38/TMEM64 family protein n=1 Tax=Halosolutus gelatinilyticus TaxID=2931975 RepID=UPI001FF27051|nr:TVP38/TMEM64 family protein [Halosolutus gelatinilyticus]